MAYRASDSKNNGRVPLHPYLEPRSPRRPVTPWAGEGTRSISRAEERAARRTQGDSTGHVAGIDGFRALAIAAVFCYHLDVSWLPSGHIGVIMFLVLTGYLATSSLLKHVREGLGAIGRFWARRFARIWPSMALMIAMIVLACIAFNHVLLTKARPDVLPALAMVENISYIVRSVSYFDQIGGPSPFTHLWYLGMDAQFCFVWPLVLLAFDLLPSRSGARRITLVLAMASALAMAVLYNPNEGITRVYYGPDTRIFAPLMGAWLAYVVPLGKRPARDLRALLGKSRLLVEVCGLISLLLLCVGMVVIPDTSAFLYQGGLFIASVLSALVLLCIVLPGGVISLACSFPLLSWLGTRSLGIYLWHFPLIQLLGAASNGAPWWKPVLVILLSLVLAEASHHLIEKPLGALLQNGRQREGTANASRPLPSAVPVVALCVLLIVLVTDGVGLAFVPDETLVPESALVSTGEAADRAIDLRSNAQKKDSDKSKETTGDGFHLDGKEKKDDASSSNAGTTDKEDWLGGIPVSEAVLHASQEDLASGTVNPLIVADSVPGDAYDYWVAQCPDGLMDSYIGRRPDQALEVLDQYLAQGLVGNIVILQAFSNVPCTSDQLDHMIGACGSDRIVYLVNVRIPESEESQINQTLAAAAQRYDNVHLIDWYSYSKGHDDWIYPDGEHLTPEGQPYYINMLVDAIGSDFVSTGGTVSRMEGTSATQESTVDTTAEAQDSEEPSVDESYSEESYSEDGYYDETYSEEYYTDETYYDDSYSDEYYSEEYYTDESTPAPAALDKHNSARKDSLRILMLGNSLTACNDLPETLAQLTGAEVVARTKDGSHLDERLGIDTELGSQTQEALLEGDWDYVILQDMSTRPIQSKGMGYLSGISELALRAKEGGATPVIYGTWAYNDDAKRLKELGMTREEMSSQLQESFEEAVSSTGSLYANVGAAFDAADDYSSLYAADGVHPSEEGSQLAAEVIAQTILHDLTDAA